MAAKGVTCTHTCAANHFFFATISENIFLSLVGTRLLLVMLQTWPVFPLGGWGPASRPCRIVPFRPACRAGKGEHTTLCLQSSIAVIIMSRI